MQLPHRTFVGIARVRALDARGIGGHGAYFFHDAIVVVAQADGVVVGLRHLLAIKAGHFRCFGQQRLRLGQDDLATAFEKAEQPLTVAKREVLRFFEQCARRPERLGVTLLQKFCAQFAVKLGAFGPELLHRRFGLGFESRLAAVDVIETACDLACELDMRHLVFAHRHAVGAIDQNIGALQQRVTEKTVGR